MYQARGRIERGGGGRGGEASWRRKGSGTKIWPSIPHLFVSHVSGGADGLGWDYVEEDDFNSDIIGEDSLTHPPHPPHPPPLSPLLSSPLSAPLSNSSPLPINQSGATDLLREGGRRRTPPRIANLAAAHVGGADEGAGRFPHRRAPREVVEVAEARRAPSQQPAEGHASHDPIQHRSQCRPDGERLRQGLR